MKYSGYGQGGYGIRPYVLIAINFIIPLKIIMPLLTT